MQGIDWGDLQFVLAVFRRESFAAAARQLGVNETTVARRIARIEKRIQARLFERIGGRASPTDAGVRLADGAGRIQQQIDASMLELAGTDLQTSGSVRLTAVPILVSHVLIPAAWRLFESHPGLNLELIAEQRNLNLTRRETDIALRLSRPDSDTQMIARKIATIEYSVYARSDTDPDELPWIGYTDSARELSQARWIAARCQQQGEPHASVIHNDALSVCESVKAGHGKSLLPDIVGRQVTELSRITQGTAPLARELWMMVHPESRRLARIDAVINWLDDLVKSSVA